MLTEAEAATDGRNCGDGRLFFPFIFRIYLWAGLEDTGGGAGVGERSHGRIGVLSWTVGVGSDGRASNINSNGDGSPHAHRHHQPEVINAPG